MPFVVVNAKIVSNNTGTAMQIPVLLTPSGPLVPLIDYCLTMRRSQSWMDKLLRAVTLFLEYLEVNVIPQEEEWRLFRDFANSLRLGTIDRETRIDPSGLYWEPFQSPDANYVVVLLSEFFDWIGKNEGARAREFNPRYAGSNYDKRVDLHAYRYRRSKAFLGHVWSDNPGSDQVRVTRVERSPKIIKKAPPSFPDEKFEELLFKGFRVAGRYDYRGMLITLILYGGGFRVSEPFHLFMADVQPHWDDPSVAFVAIHHPSLGIAPNNWRNQNGRRGTRDQYLAAEFGLTPRHLIRGRLHAGWKNPALDDKWFMQVHWFPQDVYGRWFMQIWIRYLEQVATIERQHPYAFINTDRDVGGIYAIRSYLKALEAAVERIGLVFGKDYGTTAHGPRHSYAQRARLGMVPEVIIQRIMHHCSIESQQVYTQPESREASEALKQATERLTDLHTAKGSDGKRSSELPI